MSDPIQLTINANGAVNLIEIIDHRQGVTIVGNQTAQPILIQLEKVSEEHNQWTVTVVSPSWWWSASPGIARCGTGLRAHGVFC
jgi:hypothetical protein